MKSCLESLPLVLTFIIFLRISAFSEMRTSVISADLHTLEYGNVQLMLFLNPSCLDFLRQVRLILHIGSRPDEHQSQSTADSTVSRSYRDIVKVVTCHNNISLHVKTRFLSRR